MPEDVENLFNESSYENHSSIQEKQSKILFDLVNKWAVDKKSLNIDNILDIGCGTGELTFKLKKMFPEAHILGIDSSQEQIRKALDRFGSEVSFYKANIENWWKRYVKFDLIFSNAAMHWVLNQKEAYDNIERSLKKGGLVAVHQGHKNCYKELRETAYKVINDMNLEDTFKDFEYPIKYHSKDSIENLLEDFSLDILESKFVDTENTETLVDDFIEAGLLPFRNQLDEDVEKDFVEKFEKKANKLDNIKTTRLYFVAVKKC